MLSLIRDLIEGGFVGQLIITLTLCITIAVLVVQGRDVPTWLVAMTSGVIAWFFRSQSQVYADHKAAKMGKKMSDG